MTAPSSVDDHETNAKERPAQTSGNALPEGFADPGALNAQRSVLHQVDQIASDEIFETARSDEERHKDRKVAEDIRKKERSYRRRRGLRGVNRQARADRAKDRIEHQDRRAEVTLAKAQRKRRELTDGGAALASAYSKYRLVTAGLSVGTAAGIGWAAWNVAQALGGATPALGYYLVEPLFSLPLVCILVMQIVAGAHGWLHKVAPVRTVERGGKTRRRLTGIGWIEVALLAGSAFLLVWPELTGDEINPEFLVAKLAAPFVVTITVALQYKAADLFGGIIREAWLSGDDSDANLRDRVRKANELVARVKVAMAEGSIPVQEDGFPSVSAIQKRFPSEKLTAQCARDALALFQEQEGGEQR